MLSVINVLIHIRAHTHVSRDVRKRVLFTGWFSALKVNIDTVCERKLLLLFFVLRLFSAFLFYSSFYFNQNTFELMNQESVQASQMKEKARYELKKKSAVA